jgi:hypothetical protein
MLSLLQLCQKKQQQQHININKDFETTGTSPPRWDLGTRIV